MSTWSRCLLCLALVARKIQSDILSTTAANSSSHNDCALVNLVFAHAYKSLTLNLSWSDEPGMTLYALDLVSCFCCSRLTTFLENRKRIGIPCSRAGFRVVGSEKTGVPSPPQHVLQWCCCSNGTAVMSRTEFKGLLSFIPISLLIASTSDCS